jgi:hypothetical protein
MSDNDTELSKEIENPVTRRITLPLRYEAEFLDGAYKATKDTFELDQAVVPFRLSEDWALITRTKLPVEALPPKKLGDSWAFGLSNGYTTFFLSPEHGEGFYWGVGPVLYYPSAGHSALGPMKWGSGPSAAFIKQDESPWVFGAVVNNIWSFWWAGRHEPALFESLRPLSFRRRMVPRLVAGNHDELDRERRQVDRPIRRRRRQGVSPRRAGHEAGLQCVLQRHSAQSRERYLAAAGQAYLSVPRVN